MSKKWRAIFVLLAALTASSVAWNFAQAAGMPTFAPFSSHSQVGVAVTTALAVIFLAASVTEQEK